MDMPQALLPHLETVAWVVNRLDDQEQDEFLAGLRPILHEAVDVVFRRAPDESAGEVLILQAKSYIESWVVSLRLDADPQWHQQVEETRKLVATGEIGGPMDSEELGRLLQV